MIKIDHLSKKFNENVVLDDISLNIKKGDVVGGRILRNLGS